MPNLLRVEASERIDLADWQHATDTTPDAFSRHTIEQVMTNPVGSQRTWILDGFRIDVPAGTQVRVTKGVALLAYREGGLTRFGAVSAEGDATKIVDINTFAPGTYGIYIRFEYVEGDAQNRIFWNPSGLGNEFAQTIETRRNANWSVRIELTTPGGEWTKIGEVDRATVGPPTTGITDQRPLYFEGKVNATYQSGWSTDGGGGANDRDADRQLYGVRDFQTFTAAMRQCLEDVKGRGLRRWFARDIGGMNVGFDAAPVEDRVAVGDADFMLLGSGTIPQVAFDAGDRLAYTRASNQWDFEIGGTSEVRVTTAGMSITNGLTVGFVAAPTDDAVLVLDTNFGLVGGGAVPSVYFDSVTDRLAYTRATDQFEFIIGSAQEAIISPAGLQVANGLVVGFALAPVDDRVLVGDANFGLYYSVNPEIVFDQSGGNYDTVLYRRASDRWEWYFASVEAMRFSTTGLEIREGLNVGMAMGTAVTADTVKVGDLTFGLVGGTTPQLLFDTTDAFQYLRAGNQFQWVIGGATLATLDVNEFTALVNADTVQFSLTSNGAVLDFDTDGQNFSITGDNSTAGEGIVSIHNDGNNLNREGIILAAGLDSPASNGDIVWLRLRDGNHTDIAQLQYSTSSPFAALVAASDERLKENIQPTKIQGLDIIDRLNLVEFDWIKSGTHQAIGYIAQQAREVFPAMVSEDQTTGHLLLGDACLIPVLVKAVQEMSTRLTALEAA
jgi:hypothetical protein